MTAENLNLNNVVVEKLEKGVVIVRVSRPEALNALNTQALREMTEVLQQISRDESIRVLVLTGEGNKAFIAGADIAEMKDMTPAEAVQFSQLGHGVTKLLESMPKVTIAAVNGYALGGGMEMAVACDFIIAGEQAVFGQPEVGLGIIPGFGATIRLAKFVGLPVAKELIFSGRRIRSAEAKAIGLVNAVYPAAELTTRVLELARTISAQSIVAIGNAKRLLNEFSESTGSMAKIDAEAQAFGGLFGKKDQKEGMAAFLEKRTPAFV